MANDKTKEEQAKELDEYSSSKACSSYLLTSVVILFAVLGVFYSFLKEKELSNLQSQLLELEERIQMLEFVTDENFNKDSPLPQWYRDGGLQFSKPTLDATHYRVLTRSKRSPEPGRSRSSSRRSSPSRSSSPRRTSKPTRASRFRILPTRRSRTTKRPVTPYPTQPTARTPYPTQPRLPPSPIPPVNPNRYPPSPVPPVQPGRPNYPPSPIPPIQPGRPGYPPSPIPPIQPGRPGYPPSPIPPIQPGRPGYPPSPIPPIQPGRPGYIPPHIPPMIPGRPGFPSPGYYQPGFPQTGVLGKDKKKKKKGKLDKIGKAVAIGAAGYLGAKAAKKGLKMIGKLGRASVTSMLLPHHRFRVKSHRRMKIDIDNDNINVYGFNGVTAAAHYVAHTPREDKRVNHTEEMFRSWTEAFWMNPLNMRENFRMENGAVTVLESGLYLLYAQVHYVEQAFISGFKLFVNDDPVALCVTMATTNLTATKHNTCFTSTLSFLGEHSRVYLAELEEPRTSIMKSESSFFGLINLGDPRTAMLKDYSTVDWD